MSVGLPSGSVQIRRIIYGGESEPIHPVFYGNISDSNPNALVLDTVLEYDPLIKIDGYSWNGIRNVPVSNSPSSILPQVASATLLLDLEADTLVLSDSDPVSTWADQSGSIHNFTQTGDARPTKQTIGGYPAVAFDGIDDYLDGGNFADNLLSFAIFSVFQYDPDLDPAGLVITKGSTTDFETGAWVVLADGEDFLLYQDSSNFIQARLYNAGTTDRVIYCAECLNYASPNNYKNGSNAGQDYVGSIGTVTSIANNATVQIASQGTGDFGFSKINAFAFLIYQITDLDNWATDRAAITAWLAARYGITL